MLGESSPFILTKIVRFLQGLIKQAKCLIHCRVDYLELKELPKLIYLIVLSCVCDIYKTVTRLLVFKHQVSRINIL